MSNVNVYGIGGLVKVAGPPEVQQRAPTTADVGYPIGTIWIDQSSLMAYVLLLVSGTATWQVIGSAAGNINTINSVAPVLNNINLIDQGGAGAIVVTAPGSGGAGTVGLGVNVDGVTINIVGDQLVAIGSQRQVGVDTSSGTGTDPVLPDGAGLITVGGNQVAAGVVGANVIQTASRAVNTWDVEIQRSAAVGASASANNGVCHFDSAMFTVDANGFVQLSGGGLAIDQIAVQATTAPGVSPVDPDGTGLITINGATVAAAGVPLQSRSIALNSLQLEVQRSSASAATNATAQGVASFDSASFDVDANGWVQLANTEYSAVVTTVGAVTSALFTIPLGATPGTYTFDIAVSGFCFAGPQSPGSVGYTLTGAVRTTGAAATLVPGQALDSFEEVAGLMPASCEIAVAANNAVINVIGVAADSIRWSGKLSYVFQG